MSAGSVSPGGGEGRYRGDLERREQRSVVGQLETFIQHGAQRVSRPLSQRRESTERL